MDNEYLVISLVISAGLGLIPASIAKRKGYSFGYGGFMDGCYSLLPSSTQVF